MKYKVWHYWFIVIVSILSLLFGFVYLQSSGEPMTKGILFMTIGLDQSSLEDESSSYDVQRANEHFSNVVLGWTLEPSFKSTFSSVTKSCSYNFSGQRQEKENLIFEIKGDPSCFDDSISDVFSNQIQSLLDEYNSNTSSAYVIAVETHSEILGQRSNFRVLLGFWFSGTALALFLLTLWEYVYANRR